MNKQQLATKIWESANQMRSKIEANEYKDYILGFIFYKYLSEKEIKFLKEKGATDADIENLSAEDSANVRYISSNLGYFIEYKNLFPRWLKMGADFGINTISEALTSFRLNINPHRKKVFDKIFETLESGLSKLGENAAAQTKAARSLIFLINDIPMDGKQDYDVLGFIYEYLISMFAANAGKKAGEFYTPHEVSTLMSEIVAHHLKDREEIQIYDPTSGSGSLLINIGKSISKHINNENNIKYYAQELKQNTYNLTRMNLVMRGISPDNIQTRNGDTLEEDWPYFDDADKENTYNPLYVDAVVSNPPYSQHWDPSNKENDPRYKSFGLAPKTKADYAFLLHDLYHIKPDGIMTIVLPHGVLFRGGKEEKIRKNLIEKNHIDAIIGLPANIFFGTGIPTIIMVLKQKRSENDILIIDASKGFEKVGKNNKLRASDIKRIVDTIIERKDVEKFARVVSLDEIRGNEYNLNIPRYVDSSEDPETWDLYASMFGGIPNSEIDALSDYWNAFPGLREIIFKSCSEKYSDIAFDDIKPAIQNHASVQLFKSNFAKAFESFAPYLKGRIVDNIPTVEIFREEDNICENLFGRLSDIPLIDRYKVYQILDDNWVKISADLEILQREGLGALNKVDPKMVLKKEKNKKDVVEVQDGWIGRILPFEFVQSALMAEDFDHLNTLKSRLEEINSEISEFVESCVGDEDAPDVFNEENDALDSKKFSSEIKRIKADKKSGETFDEDSIEEKLIKIDSLLTEAKSLKSKVKKGSAALEIKTKQVIETLPLDEAVGLLSRKWIDPIIASINVLPDAALDALEEKIKALKEKYLETYSEIDRKICETELELFNMLGELEGDKFDMKALKELEDLFDGK